MSAALTFACLIPVLSLLKLSLSLNSDNVAPKKVPGINGAYEPGKIFHTSCPFTVILFTCLNSHLVSQLIGNMSLDNYIGHLKHTVEGPVVINTSVNATNIGRQ